MKKLFFTLVASLLIAADLLANEAFESGGLWYKIDKRYSYELYVVPLENGYKYKGDVFIPQTVNHDGKDYLVAGIGDNAFKDCTELTSVTFEGIIKWIGNRAFENCTGLTSFTIPSRYSDTMYEGFIYLGYRAFWGCHLNSITCMIATPPYYSYTQDPSHNSSFYSQPVNPEWIGWDYFDHWRDSHVMTLYVPVGSLAKYKQEENWGYYFPVIKEWGVEEDDPVPGLYDRIDELTRIYEVREQNVREQSMQVYAVLLDGLYNMAAEEGRDITALQEELEAAFEREYDNNYIEFKVLSSLKETKDFIWQVIVDAADKLEQMQEIRIDYYTARRAGDDEIADELKPELDNIVSVVESLLDRAALELSAFTEEYMSQEAYKFMESFKADITAVTTVKADIHNSRSLWYSIDGRRLPETPSAKGLYIRDGKKVIVK